MTRTNVTRYLLPNLGAILILVLALTGRLGAAGSDTVLGQAATTTTISYQGRLTNATGQPLTATLPMVFSLYTAPTGGTAVWSENRTEANAVPITSGLFNVLLGSVTPINISLLNRDLWLGIAVNGDPEMTPRERLASVPYAARAGSVVDGSVTTAKLANGSVTSSKLAIASVTSRNLRPAVERVNASSTVTLGADLQTLVSTVVNVDVPSRVWLTATCDFQSDNGTLAGGQIFVDGVAQTHSILAGVYPLGSSTSTSLRQTASNSYVFDISPGSHTIELKGHLIGTGKGLAWDTHTGFSYMVVAR